jgi:hypothetical protein
MSEIMMFLSLAPPPHPNPPKPLIPFYFSSCRVLLRSALELLNEVLQSWNKFPNDTELVLTSRALLANMAKEVRQDTMCAFLQVLKNIEIMPEDLGVEFEIAKRRSEHLCLLCIDAVLAHAQSTRSPMMAQAVALVGSTQSTSGKHEHLKRIYEYLRPELQSDNTLIAVRIVCRIFSETQVLALTCFLWPSVIIYILVRVCVSSSYYTMCNF